jgi:ABC-type Fe3+-hydroxamate transport system substrate-binding protein
MTSYTDQLFREVKIQLPPKRIISLVPSQTELLYDLRLEGEVVGITKFCIHPQSWFKEKEKVGGTKNFWFDKIDELKPDLIIGSKEENYEEGIAELDKKYPVWMSDVSDFDSALAMIYSVAQITNREKQGDEIIKSINQAFDKLPIFKPKRVLYLIWNDPWMAAGKSTFIDSMISKLGWMNAINEFRYPTLNEAQLRELDPDVVLLSSEPYPFKENHIKTIQKLLPQAAVHLVDGEPFSWYGSRMKQAPAYFATLPFQKL